MLIKPKYSLCAMNPTSYTKFLKAFHKFQEDYNKEVRAKLVETLGLETDEVA